MLRGPAGRRVVFDVDDVLTECGTDDDVGPWESNPDGDKKHEAQGSIFVRFEDELFAEQAIEAFADRV